MTGSRPQFVTKSSWSLSPLDLAAALAYMAQGETPLMNETARQAESPRSAPRQEERVEKREPRRKIVREASSAPRSGDSNADQPHRPRSGPEPGMQTYRIEVGHQHGVKPGNILGAIANEAEIDAQYIGRIEILEDHSLVDMPVGMPRELLRELQKVWVAGQQLRMSKVEAPGAAARPSAPPDEKAARKPHRKGPRPERPPHSQKP